MNVSTRSRLIPWVTAIAVVLWTLAMALGYGLVAFSNDVANFINGLFGMSPEVMAWVSAAGGWLEQWGGWVLGVIWAIGLIALLLLGWFANRLLEFFSGVRAEART